MNREQQIEDLLDQIKLQTGITFSIENNMLDEEETLAVLKNMLHAQHSGTSKESFWRNLLLGLLSPEEILQGIHRFHIEREKPLFPILVEGRQPFSVLEQSVFAQFFSSGADTIIPIDECHVAILRQAKRPLTAEDMHQTVMEIQGALEVETMVSLSIAYDQVCTNVDQLSRVFLNLSTALEIGSIFYPTRHVFWAHNLGLGKLIYHLPKEICNEYIKDHFQGLQVNMIDEETLHTIHVFLESGLSIAECARKLYLHRNTLIYRLDKIQKFTGLDIRKFDDALTCKIAMMMSYYLMQDN